MDFYFCEAGMMKNILILILLILFSNNAISQIIGTYTYNTNKYNGVSYHLDLYENNMYKIILFKEFSFDEFSSMVISRGYYKVLDSNLYLTDYYNEYEMHFLIQNEQLIPKKTFKVFMNSYFKKYGPQPTFHTTDMQFNERPLYYLRMEYNKKFKKKFPLSDTLYTDHSAVYLSVRPNKKYQLCYGYEVISEGNWKRKGNELICFDEILQHNFYLSIGKYKIINRFFPYLDQHCFCEYGGCILD